MASLTIHNLVKQAAAIQGLMDVSKVAAASKKGDSYLKLSAEINESIHKAADAVDKILRRKAITPADLAVRSRRAYQWLKFLTQPGVLEDHLDGVQRISLFLPSLVKHTRHKNNRVEFSFYHLGAVYQVQGRPSSIHIAAQESFIAAPDTVLIAILNTALGNPDQAARQVIRDHTFTPAYRALREELEYIGIPRGSFANGSFHDLNRSFNQVNQTYFNGRMDLPHLVWNTRLTRRKFGHYQWDTDTVMVSQSLDQRGVPDFVVDYVVYHELLHKKLGARLVNTRRMVHTGKFREEEAKFARFQQAQKFLNQISRQRS